MARQLRILVVEDEIIIAYLLAEVLEGMGHVVCAIEESQAGAIAAAHLHTPDLLIVDEHLSEGSGLAVVEVLLRNGSTPHIFVSGDAPRVRRLMPDAVVISKPYHESDLARAIRRAMSNVIPAHPIDPPNENATSPSVISEKQTGCTVEAFGARVAPRNRDLVAWLMRRAVSPPNRGSVYAAIGGGLVSGGLPIVAT